MRSVRKPPLSACSTGRNGSRRSPRSSMPSLTAIMLPPMPKRGPFCFPERFPSTDIDADARFIVQPSRPQDAWAAQASASRAIAQIHVPYRIWPPVRRARRPPPSRTTVPALTNARHNAVNRLRGGTRTKVAYRRQLARTNPPRLSRHSHGRPLRLLGLGYWRRNHSLLPQPLRDSHHGTHAQQAAEICLPARRLIRFA
jgi:hypothetical protein